MTTSFGGRLWHGGPTARDDDCRDPRWRGVRYQGRCHPCHMCGACVREMEGSGLDPR